MIKQTQGIFEMSYKMRTTPADLKNAIDCVENKENQLIIDNALSKIDKNLGNLVLRTDLTASEEKMHKEIVEALAISGFSAKYVASTCGDSREPLDYGTSAYIIVTI